MARSPRCRRARGAR